MKLSGRSRKADSNQAKSGPFGFTASSIRAIIEKQSDLRLLMGNHGMSARWLLAEEIAEYLGVSKGTVYASISKRNVPAHRIGRLCKLESEEVNEWGRFGGVAESESRDKE